MKKIFQRIFIGGIFISIMLPVNAFSQVYEGGVGITNPGTTQQQERSQAGKGFDYGSKSGSALEQLEKMSGGRVNVPKANPPAAIPAAAAVKTISSAAATRMMLNNMVAGAVVSGLMNAIFSSGSSGSKAEIEAKQRVAELEAEKAAEEAAEQQRIKEANDQAEYEKMMGSYKLLDGSQNLNLKPLNNSDMDFKTLEDAAETPAADAGQQSEGTSIPPDSGATVHSHFFGDTMPDEDLKTLLDVENNPNVVDLREATKFVEQKTVIDSSRIVPLLRQYEPDGNGEPIIQKPDCIKLGKQLKGYTNQRQQFQKTIDLSQNELVVWETANRNAMINAAKDGLEYFTGNLLEGLANRVKSADKLQLILDKNAQKMAKEGINVAEIQAKIDALRALSSAGQIAEFTSNMKDWQTFVKDGMSSLFSKLSGSNDEIKGLLEDPKMQEYFETEKPELNALLDISKLAASNMVFGKWVARKMPLIACIEISIKQAYNGLDYILSLNRILKAQKINGGVMDAAKYIQKNIDNTYSALTDCPKIL